MFKQISDCCPLFLIGKCGLLGFLTFSMIFQNRTQGCRFFYLSESYVKLWMSKSHLTVTVYTKESNTLWSIKDQAHQICKPHNTFEISRISTPKFDYEGNLRSLVMFSRLNSSVLLEQWMSMVHKSWNLLRLIQICFWALKMRFCSVLILKWLLQPINASST